MFVLCCIPAARLIFQAFTDGLGVNPIEEVTHRTGWWTIVLLLVTLGITPARRWLGLNELLRFRRMTGVFAFSYAVLHFLCYIVLDQFFAFDAIVDDVIKRPYITVGFTAFLLLIPLAVTSTKAMVKRLGGKRWTQLHRLVYVSAALGVLHFLWLTKGDSLRPVWYAAGLVSLLMLRLGMRRRREAGAGAASEKPEPPLPVDRLTA